VVTLSDQFNIFVYIAAAMLINQPHISLPAL